MTNIELLTKLAASDSHVIVYYDIKGDSDQTEPMPAKLALPMVTAIERLGATVRLRRYDR